MYKYFVAYRIFLNLEVTRVVEVKVKAEVEEEEFLPQMNLQVQNLRENVLKVPSQALVVKILMTVEIKGITI